MTSPTILDQFRLLIPDSPVLGHRVTAFLIESGYTKTAAHSSEVVERARSIAERVNVDPDHAAAAAWLHDVSAVIPVSTRIRYAQALEVEIFPEERAFPLIIHQKLSVVMAIDLFDVQNPSVLSAIECHTTLKPGASDLDKVVFIADKIAWDQPGAPPYLTTLLNALEKSIDEACVCYLDYLWNQKSSLPVIHPWLVAARNEMKSAYPG